MSSKGERMIELLETQVNRGIYVWGGNGEPASDYSEEQLSKYLDKREAAGSGKTKEENIARDRKLLAKRRKQYGEKPTPPIRAFDCSGLMYYAGLAAGVFDKDLTADKIFRKCTEIAKADLKRGDFVFQHNGEKATHVGMFTGSEKVIECEGRDVGVVKQKVRKQFNRFGRLPSMNESEPEPEHPDEYRSLVRVKGKTVHVRAENNSKSKKLFTAKRSQTFPLLEIDPVTGWFKIQIEAGSGYISNKSNLTEVIEDAG